MDWFKKKEKHRSTLESHKITDPAHVEEIARLWDQPGKHARFRLWSYIAGLYPQVRKGSWSIDMSHALVITLEQTKVED